MLKLNSKLTKISVILIVMSVAISISSIVFAVPLPDAIEVTAFDAILGTILGAVQAVGSAVAIITLIVLGIKYMMGSSEEKSEYKSSMIPYVVGAVIVFAASNIVGIVFNLSGTIS